MKHSNYKITFFLVFGLFLGACNEDFLVEDPSVFVNPDSFLEDKRSAEIFLIGAYDAVQYPISSGGNGNDKGLAIGWGTLGTDEVVVPGWEKDNKLVFLHQLTPSTDLVYRTWQGLYRAGNICNSVIDRVGAMSPDQIDEESKNYIIAQARFLRATVYFGLVVPWENVPILREEVVSLDNLEVPQSSPEETYNFIIEDLTFAKNNLPAEQGGGRATKGAAQALLGKVYLQMTGFPLNQSDKFELAEQELSDVMSSGVSEMAEAGEPAGSMRKWQILMKSKM